MDYRVFKRSLSFDWRLCTILYGFPGDASKRKMACDQSVHFPGKLSWWRRQQTYFDEVTAGYRKVPLLLALPSIWKYCTTSLDIISQLPMCWPIKNHLLRQVKSAREKLVPRRLAKMVHCRNGPMTGNRWKQYHRHFRTCMVCTQVKNCMKKEHPNWSKYIKSVGRKEAMVQLASRAWKMALWARLKDGNKVEQDLQRLPAGAKLPFIICVMRESFAGGWKFWSHRCNNRNAAAIAGQFYRTASPLPTNGAKVRLKEFARAHLNWIIPGKTKGYQYHAIIKSRQCLPYSNSPSF